jgi:hypothetical protein
MRKQMKCKNQRNKNDQKTNKFGGKIGWREKSRIGEATAKEECGYTVI